MSNELSLNINRIINDIKSKTNDFKNNLNETEINSSKEDDINCKNNENKVEENTSIDSVISPKKKNFRLIPVKTLVNESNFVNFCKVILVTLCFCFFAGHVYFLTKKFLSYDTRISLRYMPPDSSSLPGITICGPFIIHPNKFMDIKKKKYSDYYNSSDKDVAPLNQDIIKAKKLNFSVVEENVIENNPAHYILTNLSLQFEDLILNCVYKNYTIMNDQASNIDMSSIGQDCKEITEVVQSIYGGRKCFTLFSRLNDFKENGIKMTYEFNPKIELTIKTNDPIWNYGAQEHPILMAVHPKTIIPTYLDFDYLIVTNQYYYQVHFRTTNATLLKTKCHDYSEDCSCMMRQFCLEDCIRQLSYPIYGCINWNGVITYRSLQDRDKFCPNHLQNYTVYMKARRTCEEKCPPDCQQTTYEMYGNTVNLENRNYSNFCTKNEGNSVCNATISIMLHHSPTVIIDHMEAYSFVDFIGEVGGHLGIWLSLSVITIIDLCLTLMEKSFKLIKAKCIHSVAKEE